MAVIAILFLQQEQVQSVLADIIGERKLWHITHL
jgi:hypothetical protein